MNKNHIYTKDTSALYLTKTNETKIVNETFVATAPALWWLFFSW